MSNRELSPLASAMLKAADSIEQNPDLWCTGHRHELVGPNYRHCALGWIEVHLFGVNALFTESTASQVETGLIQEFGITGFRIWSTNDTRDWLKRRNPTAVISYLRHLVKEKYALTGEALVGAN